jgi:hypothetical protein
MVESEKVEEVGLESHYSLTAYVPKDWENSH